MSCECEHTVCCGMLSASDTASTSLRELYRRPARRRHQRHFSRRRLLHQHVSCPTNFIRSDELSTTSADELSAWASRRTRSDLPPMGAARRYKTDRSRYSLRPPRACPLPASRRGSSRHHRTTTIVHHPCCLFDPKLCPVMKGSHHQQGLRPEDIDSETLRTTEELRSHIESVLFHHKRRQPQKAPRQPDAAAQVPGAMPQHQRKPAQQGDRHEKKCEICGNPQHVTESTVQFTQRYQRQPSPQPVGQPVRTADLLTRDVSSETADRLVDELSRRSAGPRAAHAPHRVNVGDFTGQQKNSTSGAAMNIFPVSPAAAVASAGPRKGEANMMTSMKRADIALNPPLADIHQGHVSMQSMPRPRSTATSPFLEEYFSRRPSHVLEHGNERRPPSAVKTGPPITQVDVETSYTMHSIASARAAATKNPDNVNSRRYAPSGAYSYEEAGSQPEKVTINFQQVIRRAASEGAKPADDMVGPPSPAKGVFTFRGQDANDSRKQVGGVDPELRIMPQSEPDSARFTAGTFETELSELQQTENHTEESSSSNGDFQSGNQSPADSGGGGSLRHMDGVDKALKIWQTSGSDVAQIRDVHSRTDKLSSPVPSVSRASPAGDGNQLSGCERASPQASPSSRKSVMSPTTHRGEGNHHETDVRKSGNTSHNNVNVAASDDSAVYARLSYVESLSKPEGTTGTSFYSGDCGSSTYRSNAQQGDKQQEAARNPSRVGTPPAESGCKSTANAEEKVVAISRATSRSGSIAASTKTARRRTKDRGEGDAKGNSSQSDEANCLVALPTHLSVNEQLEVSRQKIIECIDNALAYIVNSPVTDLTKSGSQPKLRSAGQFPGRCKSPMTEHGDSSDMEPPRECSSLELSSELWGHVDTTIRDSLSGLPQQRPSKGAATSPAEDRNNRKLLLKLQRDLTKNILTNLKRLEDIESLLHPSNGERPSDPPNK